MRDITDVHETPDGQKFTAAGFKFAPAGGGNYSWQKRIGDVMLQACDWDTTSPFYLVGALHDDGTTLYPDGEHGVDEALRDLAVMETIPREQWAEFAGKSERFTFDG